MDFKEIYEMKDEAEQVKAVYEVFNEENRLKRSKGARVEFITAVRYIEKHLKPGDKILDLGAGAGEYSLYFAEKGFEVSAVELSERNVADFRKKIKPEHRIDLRQGTALDLSAYEDASFDIVLVFGPLYHLHSAADRRKCIEEAKRVCKKEGTIFFAFINNDMIFLTEFRYNRGYFSGPTYDHESFKVEDFPFVFFTAPQCRQMLLEENLRIISEVAVDGASELLENEIEEMTDEDYEQYLRYHFYVCEKPEMLGLSNHFLFVAKQ